jgi:hypothetical protein
VKNRDPIAKADNVIETHEHAGEFKERIGAVPDGGSTVSLLSCALLGLATFRRKLSC